MKTIANTILSIVWLAAAAPFPAAAVKPAPEQSGVVVEEVSQLDDMDPLSELKAERDSLQAELDSLTAMIAPLDGYVRAGVEPLLACRADTVVITGIDTDRYGAAIDAFEQVRPMMLYYNPYRDLDLDAVAAGLRGKLDKAGKIGRAKELLCGKSGKTQVETSMAELDAVMKSDDLTEADREAVDALYWAIQKDLNWGNFFRTALNELASWAVLPDAKMAGSAYDKIIKPVIVDKIAEVYPGRTTLPDEFVKLNDILSRLSDVTLNYDKSRYRSKVSTETAFKAWLRQLSESL